MHLAIESHLLAHLEIVAGQVAYGGVCGCWKYLLASCGRKQ